MELAKNFEELIINAPHGSGINYDYENIRKSHGNLLFENAFQVMNEYGYYEGTLPFRVVVDKYNMVDIHFIGLNNYGKYLAYKKYRDLKDYLIDVYTDWVQGAYVRYSLEELL